MTIELLQNLSLIAYVLAVIFFLVSVALFFLLNIPQIFGDLSGRTARKAIADIRMRNEESGNRANKPSVVNVARGRLTDRISGTGTLLHKTGKMVGGVGTEKISTMHLNTETNETTVLSNETTLLSGTDIKDQGETTVLSQNMEINLNSGVSLEVEFGFTGSAEIIE